MITDWFPALKKKIKKLKNENASGAISSARRVLSLAGEWFKPTRNVNFSKTLPLSWASIDIIRAGLMNVIHDKVKTQFVNSHVNRVWASAHVIRHLWWKTTLWKKSWRNTIHKSTDSLCSCHTEWTRYFMMEDDFMMEVMKKHNWWFISSQVNRLWLIAHVTRQFMVEVMKKYNPSIHKSAESDSLLMSYVSLWWK